MVGSNGGRTDQIRIEWNAEVGVENDAKKLGTPIELVGFVRYAVGEGVDKGPTGDFADEVKQMAGR